jgi:hypothetical protein
MSICRKVVWIATLNCIPEGAEKLGVGCETAEEKADSRSDKVSHDMVVDSTRCGE